MIVLLVVAAVLLAFGWWVVRTAGWRFALKRLVGAVAIVVLVTFGVSFMLNQFDGDPCVVALQTTATEERVAQCREDRKLDESVFVQYATWAGDILSGDLGNSDYTRQIPLTDVIKDKLPRTLLLFLYSQTIALAIAVPSGVWAAYQAGRQPRPTPPWALPAAVITLAVLGIVFDWSLVITIVLAGLIPLWIYHAYRGGPAADKLVNTQAFVLLSVPVFVLGEVLRYWFAVKWSWYELDGYKAWNEGFGAHFNSMWLPAVVLGMAVAPVYLRLLRADMVQNLQQDFVLVAKSKGMSNRHILFRHVLRPSSLTLLTVAGLNIANLINGAIVVEFIFGLAGMGAFLIEAVQLRSFFPVQTIVAMVAIVFVIANTIIDLIYTSVDPRVNVEARR